jgi:hypothetical protein
MGGGFIGGDGSVKWQFHGENIRGGSIVSNGEGKRATGKKLSMKQNRVPVSF